MKTLLIAGALALASVATFPAAASAELYQYVSCTGYVKSTNAANSTEALSASDIADHSGVVLAGNSGLEISSTMFVPGAGC